MGKVDDFIRRVADMREKQKVREENPTRANIRAQEDAEYKVDEWLLAHTAEQVQIELWTRALQTDETPGAYNVTHEPKTEDESET